MVSPEKQEQQIAAELGDWGQKLFQPVVAEFLNYGRHYISCVWPFEASEACKRLGTDLYKERLQNLLRQPSLRAPGARDTYLRTLIKTRTPPTDEEKIRLTEAWRAIIASDDPDRFELYVWNPSNAEPSPSFSLCQLQMSLWAFTASEKVKVIVLYENRDILYDLVEHQSASQTGTVEPGAYAFSMPFSETDSVLALEQHGFLPDRPDRKHACFWRPNANIWERIGPEFSKQRAES